VSFIDGFAKTKPESRYVLSNELGDGRVLIAAPILTKEADAYSLLCPIAPGFPRIDVQKLGSQMASHPDTNDLYLDERGNIARVSGLDCLPQKVRTLLSMNQGESAFSPTFGMRLFEYFEVFRGSPWLDFLLKLDVIRQASIPFRDSLLGQQYTPLQCVTRVRDVELLADSPTDNRLPVRIALDVQGVGEWLQEMSIFMPTAEQMAARAKPLADTPWLEGTLGAAR
jgi:hypothetical protein